MKRNKRADSGKADWVTRCVAYALDWVIGGVLTSFPGVVLYALVTKRKDGFHDFYLFEALGYEKEWAYFGIALCTAVAFFYYVVIPWKIYPGQTLAKRWLRLSIVSCDGKALRLPQLLLRQVLGLMLLEGPALIIHTYWRQLVTILTRYSIETSISAVGWVLFFLSVGLAWGTTPGRATHDWLSNTRVVRRIEHTSAS